MPTRTPPQKPNTALYIVFAVLAAAIIMFSIYLGYNVTAAGGQSLSEWQQYIVIVLGAISSFILALLGKNSLDNKKQISTSRSANEKLDYLTGIMESQGAKIESLKTLNADLQREVTDLKYEVKTLQKENSSISSYKEENGKLKKENEKLRFEVYALKAENATLQGRLRNVN